MDRSSDFRELLVADMALVHGIADAGDVAADLHRYWNRREEGDVSLVSELTRIADLDDDQVARLEKEVEQLLQAANGDAQKAIMQRGGIDRSIHRAFSGLAEPGLDAGEIDDLIEKGVVR